MSGDRMWGGRFDAGPDALLLRVNASIGFDVRLVSDDVLGSIAHARMLTSVGILSTEDGGALEAGLLEVLGRFLRGEIELREELEDVHTHVEVALRDAADPAVAGRLHTGRSRNDQVALDEALWLRRRACELRGALLDLVEALARAARKHRAVLIAGRTHLQPAQPVTVGHHLLAHAMALLRDEERFGDLRRRARACPLGSGSLAGSPLPLDRALVASLLGFEGGPTRNTMDGVASRDLLCELCQVAGLAAVQLSRLAEDLISLSSPPINALILPDSCCTGSSLMPQKRNPDALELVRGKAARPVSAALRLLMVLKGQPLAYNKDLQEDKEAAFDATDQLADALALTQLAIDGLDVDEEACVRTVEAWPDLMATDLADHLVLQGVPFREAHEVCGRAVALCEEQGKPFSALTLDELRGLHASFGPDALEWLDPRRSVSRRSGVGGPAPHQVDEQAVWVIEECTSRRDANGRDGAPSPLLAELSAAGTWPGADD